MTSYETGTAGELEVLAHIRSMGIKAEREEPNDILTSNHIIEVKTANRTRYRRERPAAWQFLLYKRGHTEKGYADFVVLVCNDREEGKYYIIPANKLPRSKVTIPSRNYRGKYAKYLAAWEQLR